MVYIEFGEYVFIKKKKKKLENYKKKIKKKKPTIFLKNKIKYIF